ncbi:MAG: T9SS type A sorting domain-containing protein [Bacteroidetes bacterium]|nr:T9SS type A sorting domain-containing protein [Bacteroidota bacterium]
MRFAVPGAMIALCLPTLAAAQTGPGGVGTSATNVLWLSADQGVAQAGGLVSTWTDRSGNANDALVPPLSSTATPGLVAGAANGLPVLRFDGDDDQLWVDANGSLDLTAWHFFLVVRPNTLANATAWLTKGDDGTENYAVVSYADGGVRMPIRWTDDTRTTPSTPGGQLGNAAFRIFEYSYKASAGRAAYTNGAAVYADAHSKTPLIDPYPLYIGNEKGTSNGFVDGDIAEVIAYNAPLNAAQRLIVDNHLAAKYGLSLASGDLYVQDDPANGDLDRDVAGIGRMGAAALQLDPGFSGRLSITSHAPPELTDNEFLFWGHDDGAFSTLGNTDHPASLQGRWDRIWRVSEVNTTGAATDVGPVDITFDLFGLGPVAAADLRLLVDENDDGLFADETPIDGAAALGNGRYRFADVTALADGHRFTLGSTDIANTPLPIDLLSFSVAPQGPTAARVQWSTASERDNEGFTIERSADAGDWKALAFLPGAGVSATVIDYTWTDADPLPGTSYYRLKQTDHDGRSSLSEVVSLDMPVNASPLVTPNPAKDRFLVMIDAPRERSLRLVSASGRVVDVPASPVGTRLEVDASRLTPGAYVLQVGDADRSRSVRVIVE